MDWKMHIFALRNFLITAFSHHQITRTSAFFPLLLRGFLPFSHFRVKHRHLTASSVSARNPSPMETMKSMENLTDIVEVWNSLLSLGRRQGPVNSNVHENSLEERSKTQDLRLTKIQSETIPGYGKPDEDLRLFQKMERAGLPPSRFILGSIIKASAALNDLELGKQLHSKVLKLGFSEVTVTCNLLIELYGKCGLLDDARQLFDKMSSKNLLTWNTMISLLAQNGLEDDAVELFQKMGRLGIKWSEFTLSSVLSACANSQAEEQGKQIHVHALKNGCSLSLFVGSALVNMYAKCCRVLDARKVFDRMSERNVVSWTGMMVCYVKNGYFLEALRLYLHMHRFGLLLNDKTFASVLSASAAMEDLEMGRQIHAHSLKVGLGLDNSVGNGLINMYAKCRSIKEACRMFDLLPSPDRIAWNSLIAGFSQNGNESEALRRFILMKRTGITADPFTFASVLSACTDSDVAESGKQIHAVVLKTGLDLNVSVANALITLYSKLGSIEQSLQIFNSMPRRDLISWNAIIGECVQNQLISKAFDIFQQMQRMNQQMNTITYVNMLAALAPSDALHSGRELHAHIILTGIQPDYYVENALITMYAKSGRVVEARHIFDTMSRKDVVSWNSILAAYAVNGKGCDALSLVRRMPLEGVTADHFTLSTIIRVCSGLAALEFGKEAHAAAIRADFDLDVVVASALVDMYAKCGCIEEARYVFDNMPTRNDISWNAMVTGYAHHGLGKEALQIFDQMLLQGVKPTHVTFVCVLTACSHAGLVDKGKAYFDSMVSAYNISPRLEHYACMVDLLGRAGHLDKAKDFVERMPLQPTSFIWKTLLASCRSYGNTEIGNVAAKHLFESEPHDTYDSVMLSDICASFGRG